MNKYNLIDILTKEVAFEENRYKFNGIQIPMIQRDYAQGREGEGEIRKRFLKAIFNALENSTALDLDFVYGAKKTIDNNELFIPLDGQQRLTTLYLLNWYIGNRELDDDKLQELRNSLAKFSYATRATSDTFCEILSKTTISFITSPSEEIKNASWFFDSYKLDPTVQSMLVMLDAIHIAYGAEKKDLYSNLNQIRFYILPLDGFDLTDELYIKMNARGKQLTYFENFKADLIKWVKDPNNPFKDDFQKEIKYDKRSVKYHLYFELKLDNNWTHLFWKFSKKNEKSENKLVDPYMLQFWNRYLLNSFIVSSNLNQDEIENDTIFKKLYGNQGDDSNFKYNDFDLYKTLLEEANRIEKIEKVFENLFLYHDEVNETIKPNWDKSDRWFLFSGSINQRQRILFFAVSKYFEENQFDILKFKNWIRVVWNIIIDPNIRSVPAMVGAMRFIDQIAEHSNDINTFLRKTDSVIFLSNATYQEQIEEEHHKAILIDKAEEWEALIIEAESHAIFQGKIRFMLTNYADTNIESFKKNKNTSFDIFKDNDLSDQPENYLWIRALLAKGVDEDVKLPITLSNGRFSNWRYLINDPLMRGMRFLVEDISKNTTTVEEGLKDICADYQINDSYLWVYPLVNWEGENGETLLGNYSVTRKIQKYDNYGNAPEHVYLYNQTRWTEGNIIISNNRNEIVSELLKNYNDIKPVTDWSNIQNSFFRGWNVQLERKVGDFNFTYVLDKVFIRVGIKSTLELEEQFKNFSFNDNNKEQDWICRLKYDYTQIEQDGIISFLTKIENDVFYDSNPESLINRMKL